MTGGPADDCGLPLAFAIAGAGFFAWFMWLFRRARASRTWPATEGRILSSQAQNFSRAGAAILVYYEYSVDGREYTGKRLRFAPPISLSYNAAQADLLNYRPGNAIQVHYNPASPDDSVVEPGVVPYLWYCIAGSVGFCALMIALYISRTEANTCAALRGDSGMVMARPFCARLNDAIVVAALTLGGACSRPVLPE